METRADSAPVRSAMPSPLSPPSPPPRLLLLARPAPAGRSKSFLVASPGSGALLVNPFAPARSCHSPGPSFAARPLSPLNAGGPALPRCSPRARSGRRTGLVRRRRPRGCWALLRPLPQPLRAVPPGGAPGVCPEPTALNLFLGRSCAFSLRVSFFPEEGCEFHSSSVSKKEK